MELTVIENPSRTCTECRGNSEGRRENYTYTESGLKNVVLVGVLVYRCARCGAEQIEIPNMDGLHRTVALAVLCKSRLLSGDEIRFLRKVAGFTATNLAKALAVTKNAVSRWENTGKIGPASDRAVRAICGIQIIADIVEQQAGIVDPKDVERTLQTLQRFFVQFTPQAALSSVRDEVGEAEKLMIDPSQPFNFSLLPSFLSHVGPDRPAIQ
jgi:putative zinc finger/helix-turn-helix YgiT family protein